MPVSLRVQRDSPSNVRAMSLAGSGASSIPLSMAVMSFSYKSGTPMNSVAPDDAMSSRSSREASPRA